MESAALGQLDVVLKSFNRPDCLRRLVASWNQWYPGVGLTIVDDSTIPMDCADARWSRHRFVALPPDSGISAGRNAGIAATDKEFVLLLEDDFVSGAGADLGALLALLDVAPEVGIVGGVAGGLAVLARCSSSVGTVAGERR